ncbi:hypothetical protein [Bradyrhizobium sp. G127]|uniref:hypothetical protein n=1 Tax=Bradyrhizobium sp. G127 TaxID=2904800 RepID=UPI001F375A0B|nr:hypothetical protein [Bradyrhizobium sp. G127]MCF2523629.1 hypothetical protein [Bradyrhizobium sp. G127]
MSSRFEKVLAQCSPTRPTKTKTLDHLSGLVIRARDGEWDDLIEHINGNKPITRQGRASLALLLLQLSEHRAGRPSGAANAEQEAKQIAVWFMHAARDRFLPQPRRLTRAELEVLEASVLKHANEEFARGLKPPLKKGSLIGKGKNSRGHPYGRKVSKNIERIIQDELWPLAPSITNELVAALTAHAVKSKPGR